MKSTTRTPWRALAIIAVLLAGLVIAGCGGDGDTTTGADAAPASDAAETVEDTTSEVANENTDGEEVVLNLGVLQGATLAYFAQELGTLDEELAAVNARVEFQGPFPAMVPAIEAINAGDVDVSYGSISAAIGAWAGNSDFKIFAIEPNQPETEGLIATAESGIESIDDLAGARIAVNQAGTGEYLALLALDQAGLTTDDVELVYLAPADAAQAFGSGQVDVWATWSAFTGLAQEEFGGKLIADGGDLGSLNDIPYIVRAGFADEHPEVLEALFRGLGATAEWIRDNEEDAAAIYAESGLSETVAAAQAAAATSLAAIDDSIVDRFQRVADYVAEKGIVPEVVQIDGRTINNIGS